MPPDGTATIAQSPDDLRASVTMAPSFRSEGQESLR